MGQWVINIEGHGIHDNGREDDVDAMLRDFTDRLRSAGHSIGRVSLTVGATRALTTGATDTTLVYHPAQH